jgi:mono/diheme cytochrome c family protein/heme/copper-type cytochrome/quinol oxidase subunit 4
MSDHAHAQAHDHGEGEHTHSHVKLYTITAVVLSVITFVELLVVPDIWQLVFGPGAKELDNSIVVPSLYVLAALKFIGVIALFMHLKDDNKIFSFLFLSPLFIAVAMITVLSTFAIVTYKPFSHASPGIAADFNNQDDGYQETERMWRDSGKDRPKPATAEELVAGYDAAEKSGFAAGKKIFDARCAACHRADGGGAIGPAFTDNCYKNGGSLYELAKSVREGVPGTAMAPMKYEYDFAQIRQVAYYVRSLHSAKVDSPKPCEGPVYTGE